MAALVETPLARIPFGRYQLLHRLARGGMAETFRAQLTGAAGVTKPVVIKRMLPSHAASSTLVAEFINEARIGANLSHGNIAQVLDFGCVGSNYYLALELVDGCSLAQLLKRSEAAGSARVPVPVACAIAIEVLKGRAQPQGRRRTTAEHRPPRHQPREHPHQLRGRDEGGRFRSRQVHLAWQG
jgi:serine/threonine protein kinase